MTVAEFKAALDALPDPFEEIKFFDNAGVQWSATLVQEGATQSIIPLQSVDPAYARFQLKP